MFKVRNGLKWVYSFNCVCYNDVTSILGLSILYYCISFLQVSGSIIDSFYSQNEEIGININWKFDICLWLEMNIFIF